MYLYLKKYISILGTKFLLRFMECTHFFNYYNCIIIIFHAIFVYNVIFIQLIILLTLVIIFFYKIIADDTYQF